MSDTTSKGPFHQAFGVPFQTWISGGGAQYQKDKQQMQRQLSQLQSEYNQQMKIEPDLAKQRSEVEQNIQLLATARTDSLSDSEKLQKQQIDLEKRIKDRHEYPFKPDANNAPAQSSGSLSGAWERPARSWPAARPSMTSERG